MSSLPFGRDSSPALKLLSRNDEVLRSPPDLQRTEEHHIAHTLVEVFRKVVRDEDSGEHSPSVRLLASMHLIRLEFVMLSSTL